MGGDEVGEVERFQYLESLLQKNEQNVGEWSFEGSMINSIKCEQIQVFCEIIGY